MLDVDAAIEEVLAREEPVVPLAPATARALSELLGRADHELEALRRHAFADPAVAAAILCAANVEGGEPVVSLPDAEARLGPDAFVRVLREAAAAPLAVGPLADLRRKAWRGSVVSAVLCRELARARGLPAEEAYTCGLLHDVGRLAAICALERIAAAARQGRLPAPERWERLADRWHVALGAAFAERWRLPAMIRDAISAPFPERVRPAGPSPLQQVVRSVDRLVAVLVGGRDSSEAVAGAALAEHEAARLSRTLERLQEHVASLEGPPSAAAVRHDASGGGALREPKGPGLRLRLAGREYAATGFLRHQLFVSGPAPLGEGALLEVEVLDRRQGPFHARVLSSWSDGPRFGAILLPLGLGGPSLAELGGTLPAGGFA
ncbi:MAG TPA: HDOD domain-containing protein [Anaeromyxobacter sp.]